MSVTGIARWEEMWVGGASMEECPLGAPGYGRRCKCHLPKPMWNSEKAVLRAKKSQETPPLTFVGFPSGHWPLRLPLFPLKLKPPTVNNLCPILGLQKAGHGQCGCSECWQGPRHSQEAGIGGTQNPGSPQGPHKLNQDQRRRVPVV